MRSKPSVTQQAGLYLAEAADLVTGPRAQTHGNFIEQHERAAKMIRAYIDAKFGVDLPLRASDVMRFLSDIKDSRQMTGKQFDPDHARDQIGYAALRAVALETERSEQQERK